VDQLDRFRRVKGRQRELVANSIIDAVKDLVMALLRVKDELEFISNALSFGKKKPPTPPTGGTHLE